ncbi:siderophore biosynthesis protein SbnG [Massilia sp. Root351]|uniref:HpcH/HpaI aldolase family protein n=1 Tax=Massilia sp. Root351 TaxID=1736522 RepID=UPI00070D0EB8|nr:aldolase/citrate lyase family protein [Massilia sp. Root351]KQV84940.1 siderophore biosynthesis protein SbnG [Massilia sp. Root351]
MLKPNRLRQKLSGGGAVHGLLNSMPCALMVEMIACAGYDFVILDTEHVCVNPETLEHMLRAAECAGLPALVRVPAGGGADITRALDAGAMGVVVPHVCTADDARAAVQASRYHPLGRRGISGGRTTGFGAIPLTDYFGQANREIMVVAMIEDAQGVENIDSILSVPGIDMVLEGAIDLSQSLGHPGLAQHPQVQAAIGRVADACRARQVPFCAIPREAGQHAAWLARGVRAFLLGDDRGVSFRALKAHVGAYRDATASNP